MDLQSPVTPVGKQQSVNVMESLVAQEVDWQIQQLPRKVARYVNRVEVITYALNRLPCLYACSQKGMQLQTQRAKRDLREQIQTAVRQGLIAVQQDPLRVAVPLYAAEDSEAHEALQKLKLLLQNEGLTWKNLVSVVEHTLIQTLHGEMTWKLLNPSATPTVTSQRQHLHRRDWTTPLANR